MKKGQKKYWKCMFNKSDGTVYRKSASGFPHEINGRLFFSDDEVLGDLSGLTDAHSGFYVSYKSVKKMFEKVVEAATKQGDVMDLPEKQKG